MTTRERVSDRWRSVPGAGTESAERHHQLGRHAELYLLESGSCSWTASGKDFNVIVQVAGAGGNVKYISPVVSYRQFFPMKGLRVNREGHNVLGYRMQFAHIEGFGGEVAPPHNRVYCGGEIGCSRVRHPVSSSVYLHSEQGAVQPDQPGRDNGSARPDAILPWATVQIPLPIYRLVSIGGDTA